MQVRTSVFVYADDAVSQAGLEQLLRTRAEVCVVASGQIDEAQVAVVSVEEIDDEAVRTITGIQRDGCPKVLVIATRLDDAGMVAASEAGSLGMMRRREITADGLVRVVQKVAVGEASVPSDLVGQLLGAVRRLTRANGSTALMARTELSEREREVVRLLADGSDTAEIASTLCYSERTVKGVIHDVTRRLQLRNRSHVVAFALRNGMI